MRIFVTGQTSVHWGRKEFGNVGNYYVTEGFFREVHRVFPDAEVYTTLQMSDEFIKEENITCLDLEMYYNWNNNDLSLALKEYSIALLYNKTKKLVETTPFIEEVLKSDLIIDHSGDMWGQNADLAGDNRFIIGLLKDRTVQLFDKKIVLLGASPGPFDLELIPFVDEVLSGFDFVTTRDALSRDLLKDNGLRVENVFEYACPSYLFNGCNRNEIVDYLAHIPFGESDGVVGLNLCGWNMSLAPFSKWPREDDEYDLFVELIEFITDILKLKVVLFSHSNGFLKDPEFKLIQGRDFPIVQQLFNLIHSHKKNENVFLLDGVYTPKETKAIIGEFDMLISGRLHGAVAALSQNIPTVILDYGHEPKAHKLIGFARQLGLENCVVDPHDIEEMRRVVSYYWNNRVETTKHLSVIVPQVKMRVNKGFDLLKTLL